MRKKMISLILLMVTFAIILNGCAQIEPKASETSLQIVPTIAAQSVSYYYKSDRSVYITKQTHRFNPDAGCFEMSAKEPIGDVECSLIRDDFALSGSKSNSLSDLPGDFCNKKLAVAVFYSFCAGSGLLDTTSLAVSGEDVKIEGQWYVPLRSTWPKSPELILYRSVESNRIELTQVNDSKGPMWLLRDYNYKYHSELDTELPRTIDVFSIENGISSKELMIRFDYQNIRKLSL